MGVNQAEGKDKNPQGDHISPTVVLRQDHSISRKNIHPNALKVLYRLHNHGYKAYLVGGSVRDLLLKKKPKDFDVATDARPSQLRKLFSNSRIIGRRFRLAHIMFYGGNIIEVSTFRKKSEWSAKDTMSPIVSRENTFGTPAEDAFRRDLTINGLFYNVADFTVIDYVNGLKDLRRGLVRVIGDAQERLCEDPIRMIRVIRHAALTGFKIDPTAFEVIRQKRDMILQCAAPRVREEFMAELRRGCATPSFRLMIKSGLLFTLFPPYKKIFDSEQWKKIEARLMNNLTGVDKVIDIGGKITDQELLAAFINPLVPAYETYGKLPSGRKAVSVVNRRIRNTIKPMVQAAGFSKGNAEAVCYMIFAQFMLHRAISMGKLPRLLTNKNYFGPGLRLYQIEAIGRSESMPRMFVEAARSRKIELLPYGRDKKRRHRRKRPRANPAKSIKEVG